MADYSYYFARLAGGNPPVILSEPQPGFYRDRDGNPVAIFIGLGDELVPRVGEAKLDGVRYRKGEPYRMSDLQILEAWPFIAGSTVAEKDWRAVAGGAQWPDEAPGLGHNQPPDDAELPAPQRADKVRALAADWRERHPDPLTTEAESAQAAHYITELRRLAGDLEDARKREQTPFLSIVEQIRDRYRALIAPVDAEIAALKKMVQRFLDDQKAAALAARQAAADQAARKAALAPRQAAEAPAPAPEAPAPLSRVGARGKAVFERKRYAAEIIDYPKALAAVADTPEIRSEVQRLANEAARGYAADRNRKPEFGSMAARKLLPGTRLKEETAI